MNAPAFRSTAAFAARARSVAPAVERAAFVTFSIGGRRLAAPVETVERVLNLDSRAAHDATHVTYADRDVPLVDLASYLGLVRQPSASSRILILKLPSGWLAAAVDEVHDVAVVDAALISLAGRGAARAGAAKADIAQANIASEDDLPPGVQGTFVQRDQRTLVLDVGRALGFRFS